MDLRLDGDQEALQTAAQALLARECPPALARRRYADPAAAADALWRHVTESGWTALLVPASCGGLGLGAVELALVLEEAGRALAPVPLWETAALAVAVVRAAGDADLLAALAAGTLRATAGYGGAGATGGRLSGTLTAVPEAHVADVLVVVADDVAYAVDPADADVRRHDTLDRTRALCDVVLDGTPARPLGAVPRLDEALAPAVVGLAAELVGAARWLLETTVAYVGVREQFGVPVGSFQAVQHQCADLLVAVERAAAAVLWAARCVDRADADRVRAVAVAKASAGDAARHAAKTAVQLHGGIGYTWEHDLHLYVRRVYTAEPLLGGAEEHRGRLARMLVPPRG